MSNIWDEFDSKIDEKQLQNEIEQAKKNGSSFDPLPDGTYNAKLSKLEQKLSKTKKPMISISMKVTDGKYKNRLMFMNRVIGGTKNDASMISGIESWLDNLEAEDEEGNFIPAVFHTYSQFADLVADIEEAVTEMDLEYEVDWEDGRFDPIKIMGVLDD